MSKGAALIHNGFKLVVALVVPLSFLVACAEDDDLRGGEASVSWLTEPPANAVAGTPFTARGATADSIHKYRCSLSALCQNGRLARHA